MRTRTYPSDLTDQPWRRVRPLTPVYPGGRPRTTCPRAVPDAASYVRRTGCQWRFLPKDFPPKSAVRRYLGEWRHTGTLEAAHDRPREKVRKPGGRTRTPSAGSIDSQSVPATAGGEARGYDASEKVDGRKRRVVVGTLGLLLAVAVTAASADDGAAATNPPGKVAAGALPRLRLVGADQKDRNREPYGRGAASARYEGEVVRRPAGAKGFVVLPRRWVVERTFAGRKRCRRRTADRGKTTRPSEAMVRLAMIRVTRHRLRPAGDEAEFRYRKAA